MLRASKTLLALSFLAFTGQAQAENLWAGVDNQYELEEVEILAVIPMPPQPEVLVVEQTPSKIEYDKPVTLDVKFEFDKATIIPQYYEVLSEMATFIKDNDARVLIEGHTDSKGSMAYNQRLSERRAQAVKDFMVKGWDLNPQDIHTVGRGETVPVATNDTDEGRQMNRRVIAVAMKPPSANEQQPISYPGVYSQDEALKLTIDAPPPALPAKNTYPGN